MTSSNFDATERRSASVKEFHGDGWVLTCAATSYKELTAIIGDEAESIKEDKPDQDTDLPLIRYESDWADTVLRRSKDWKSYDGTAPPWLAKATEGVDCALFQLPPPDHRWIVKFHGRILDPFNYRMVGWEELHEIMTHGYLLDRTEFFIANAQDSSGLPHFTTSSSLRLQGGNLLRSSELIRRVNNQEYGHEHEKSDEIGYSATGARLHGLETQLAGGKITADRWRSCADDFNKHLRDRLDRVLSAIGKQDQVAAATLKRAIKLRNGQWSFNDSVKWMTRLGKIPYDATMALVGDKWEITFPDSSEPLIVPDSVGIRAIARVLMGGNIACPCAFASDSPLLSEFLARPQHRRYFKAIYRRPRVQCGDSENGEVERAICTAMRLRQGWSYIADHVITEDSELHTVCGLPMGLVTLTRADALEGVRDLVRKQAARIFFCGEPSPQFKRILAELGAGIIFARKHEKLLQQIQPQCKQDVAKVQKAIYRANLALGAMGDWTTRYDRLAAHFSRYIRSGIVIQYSGPYRWRIQGISQLPDTLDMAADHVEFKRRKARKAIREAKARFRARQFLPGTSGMIPAELNRR